MISCQLKVFDNALTMHFNIDGVSGNVSAKSFQFVLRMLLRKLNGTQNKYVNIPPARAANFIACAVCVVCERCVWLESNK